MKLWAQVTYEIPEVLVDEVSAFLVELSPDGVVTENLAVDTFSLGSIEEAPIKRVSAFFPADEKLSETLAVVKSHLQKMSHFFPELVVKDPSVSYLEDEDWSNNWKIHFKPSRIGNRIVVKPTWEEYIPEGGDIVVEIDPGMAFGTGTHATTRLCMEEMEKIFFREGAFNDAPGVRTVLDVGTGSGILSIAAAKFGASHVVGIDIDDEAVTVAHDNAVLNGVAEVTDISKKSLAGIGGTFDIVVANILAEELARMARELLSKVNQGCFLMLSGILVEKEPLVIGAFSFSELALVETTREGEWSCLTFRRVS